MANLYIVAEELKQINSKLQVLIMLITKEKIVDATKDWETLPKKRKTSKIV